MDGSFVTTVALANPEMGIFLVDDDLDNFVTSGEFTAMYIKRYVRPFLIKNTELDCIRRCRHPGEQLDNYRKDVVASAMTSDEQVVADAMINADAPPGTTESSTQNEIGPAHGNNELWRSVAQDMVRAGVWSFVPSRATKIVQLGPPKSRLSRLESFLSSGHFYKFTTGRNGDRISFVMPIVSIPGLLQPANFNRGQHEYSAEVDYGRYDMVQLALCTQEIALVAF